MKSMATISFYLYLLMAPLLSCALATNLQARDGGSHRPAQVHKVQVGGPNIFAYTPSFVFAKPGDIILFDFLQLNHTLTQSSFKEPCTPLPGGIDSGFKPNPMGVRGLQTFELKVPPGDDPLWFFCRQGRHCSDLGMVFAINPNVEKDFTTFFARAKGLIP
ncbi:hypothetical protein EV426DRAFT_563676 [Tirmania nivea]|nr:hypothetical protein EV426DRAFT_563676 [Tirmania nivea]